MTENGWGNIPARLGEAEMTPEIKKALDLVLEKINKAREKVAALCDGKERWTMSVPVRPDYDHDVVISSALSVAEDAIKQALEQPVQEPVAWIDSVMGQAQVFASAWSLVGGRFDSGNGLKDAEQAKAELRAMLTTPPAAQQQWVGLMDEEIDDLDYLVNATGYCSDDLGVEGTQAFGRAIEAKLKEKNT